MKIHEDRSHMNIDTRWFEKGYIKEDVHSLRLQSLCTEAEAAANKQFYDSHTREEWDQYIRQASLESSAAMKPVMEAIAQDFVCYQYDEISLCPMAATDGTCTSGVIPLTAPQTHPNGISHISR